LSDTQDITAFGPFRLDPGRRLLCRGDTPVALSSRAFDILVLLVAERGRVVSKDEILSHVWRGTIVEENNLAVQMSALRRALADGADGVQMIMTVPGHGYRFVAPVHAPVIETVVGEAAIEAEPVAYPHVVAPAPKAGAPMRWFAVACGAVACGAVVLAVVALIWVRPAPSPPLVPPPAPPRLSIAVLPFRDYSDDRCCDYLADAITDDLTTDLSHIPGSVVIARESSDAFRGAAVPTAQIGHVLNVRYLLEGSLRAVENRFSINAQLIEAATGGHLWAERFEVPRDHLADAQTTIVHRLASALGVTLVDIEGSASLRERAQNPDALDLFLRARSILDRSDTLESMTEAQHLLEQAVARQPGFTEAQAELAWLLPRKISSFAYATQAQDRAEARATVAAALKPPLPAGSQPGIALALAAKGSLQYDDGKCGDAAVTYQAALALEPDSVAAQTGLVVCNAALGRFADAITGLQALMRIDPESPRNKTRAEQMGLALLMLGKPNDAAWWLKRSLSGDPEPLAGGNELDRIEWAHLLLIAAVEESGGHESAVQLYHAYAHVWPYRTAWQLGSQCTRAQSQLEAFPRLLAAWRNAGMPAFADDAADFGVPETFRVQMQRAFAPTPSRLAGVAEVTTQGLVQLLKLPPPPQVIDVGGFAAVPKSATASTADPLSDADMDELAATILGNTAPGAKGAKPNVVVMGRGPFDWTPINVIYQLKRRNVASLSYYRGGEEAWARSGAAANDLRNP
jgi:TolB-like protein/DNA-binding winged helix-turn-helix (wHTH) protein